jgi:hypothetical protein
MATQPPAFFIFRLYKECLMSITVSQSKGTSCLGTLGIAFIFLLLGGGLSFWGWTILQDARASATWPAADGLIVGSEVDHSTDAEGGDSYSPEVDYTYQVSGQAYQNSRIKFGENSYNSRRQAEEIVARYPSGQGVTVYYAPEEPENSVLEPGVSSGSYIVLGIGVCFASIALLLVPISLFTRRRR